MTEWKITAPTMVEAILKLLKTRPHLEDFNIFEINTNMFSGQLHTFVLILCHPTDFDTQPSSRATIVVTGQQDIVFPSAFDLVCEPLSPLCTLRSMAAANGLGVAFVWRELEIMENTKGNFILTGVCEHCHQHLVRNRDGELIHYITGKSGCHNYLAMASLMKGIVSCWKEKEAP